MPLDHLAGSFRNSETSSNPSTSETSSQCAVLDTEESSFLKSDGAILPSQNSEIPGSNFKPSKSKFPPALMALSLGSFVVGTTEFLPVAMQPIIAEDLNVSIAVAGLLVSGYAAGVVIMTPILSALFSGFSRRSLLIFLMGLFFVTNLLAAISPNYSFLLVMRFITAFSHGTYFAAASTVAPQLVSGNRRVMAISLLFLGLTISIATIVPVAAFVGEYVGWRVVFAGTAVVALIATASIAWFLPELPLPDKKLTLGQQFSMLREPRMVLSLMMTAVGYAGTFATFTYLVSYLRNVSGFTEYQVPILLSVLGIGVTIGNFIGGRLSDIHNYAAIIFLFALVAVGLLMFPFVSASPVLMIVAVSIMGLFMFSPGSGLQILSIQQATRWKPGAEAVASGLSQSAFNLGICMGSAVGAAVETSVFGLKWIPAFSSGIVLCAILLTAFSWWVERRDRAAGRLT